MPTTTTADTTERFANHFVTYLFDQYQGALHVRRVATWIGFLLKAIEKCGSDMRRNRSRQIVFDYRGRRFKARFDHQAARRGGIEIVEVLPGRGAPDGDIVLRVTSLAEAEEAYHGLQSKLDAFIG